MLQWDEVEENTAYRVMIFDGTTHGLIQDDTVEGETLYLWTLPDQYDEVLAGVAVYDRGTGKYQTCPYRRSAEPDATVVYPEGDVINSRTLMVKVEFSGAYEVSAALNGELLVDGSTEAGEYRVDVYKRQRPHLGALVSAHRVDRGNGIERVFGTSIHLADKE